MRTPFNILLATAFCAGAALGMPTETMYPGDYVKRQSSSGHQTVTTKTGIPVRYKDTTGKLCEVTPGVRSFTGYVDLAEDKHTFFWFFAARNNPEIAPTTLWLSGGPGVDGENGLFYETGPCAIDETMQSNVRNASWNQYSNMIYIDQPFGVGFSYQGKIRGSINALGEIVAESDSVPATGLWPSFNTSYITSTAEAAVPVWEAVQAIMAVLPQIDSNIKSNVLNIAAESYGGHWGPGFLDYFHQQNEAIKAGMQPGRPLKFECLTIISGLIDAAIQYSYYVPFAVNNTYGLKLYGDDLVNHANFANTMIGGCQDLIALCRAVNTTTPLQKLICVKAVNMCRDQIETPYSYYSGRYIYDIRSPASPVEGYEPITFINWLNLPEIQEGLGVDLNYTNGNSGYQYSFLATGDWVLDFKDEIARALDRGVRVVLMHGDADWICNWFGGEAVSLAIGHSNAAQFTSAGYAPFMVDGIEKGQTREQGNLSFTRVYESGHGIPSLQPEAAHALFYRALMGLSAVDGSVLRANTTTSGPATLTQSNTLPPWAPTSIDTSSIIAAQTALARTAV